MFASVESALLDVVVKINTYLSNYILVFLLIAVGLWYSIKTRFVQVRCFGEGMKKVFGNLSLNGKKHDSGMTSFQALATAIAAQVGTGNIVGASGAILTGGPGAIFWMWIIAFFGMATIYAEATLALKTRVVDKDGTIHGGPVYYITTAFKGGFGKFLAGFFAVAIILALGFMGCMVQSNSIGSTFQTAFGIPSWIVGLVLVAICGNNRTLERNLRALIHTPRLQVLGFTDRMSDYMDAADLFITKPGGLSTTEAATKGLPLVLFNAVPGCETRNLEFLLSIGCAVSENGALSLARCVNQLLADPEQRRTLAAKCAAEFGQSAVERIYEALRRVVGT